MSGDNDAPPPKPKALIFESYGWRDAGDVARALADDLRAAGYEVWIDREQIREQLRPQDKFPEAIRRGIREADVVLVLISPHAVRLPGDAGNPDSGASVCLNELLQAHEDRKPIVPVIVIPCEPPFLINIVRRIDLSKGALSPSAYRQGLGEILAAIEIARERGASLYISELERLHPLDFRAEVVRGAKDFCGRGWLFERIAAWSAGRSRCLVIEGDAGSGKSAIVGELVRRDPAGELLAYHFCRADRTTTVQAAAFVRSMAAMIGGRLAAYGALLNGDDLRLRLVGDAATADPLSALMSCIVTPLTELPRGGTRIIVVDALDEALTAAPGGGVLSIPQLLARALPDFPDWLKLIVTTRRDPRMSALFHDAERIRLSGDSAEQRADVAAYLAGRALGRRASSAIEARSGGNFLYARQVAEALDKGEIRPDELDRLPSGLAALYARTFQQRFPGAADFAAPERVLGVVLAAMEPLSTAQIAAASGLRLREEVLPALESLTGFVVPVTGMDGGNMVTVFHKSLADWATGLGAGAYQVDVEEGRGRLLAWCRTWRTAPDPYALAHLIQHLLTAGHLAAHVAEAVQAVRDGFFARRSGRLVRADLDDTSALAAALIAQGDTDAVRGLATTGSAWQRDGAAAALQAAPESAGPLVERIVDQLLRVPMKDPRKPVAEVLAARRTAIRVAEARGLDDFLLQAARDKSPPVRLALATTVYRHWLRTREGGWRLVDRLAGEMFGALSLPRPAILEALGHASLAILNNHRHEAAEMERLLAVWRGVAQRITGGALVRVLGQGWALRLMLRPMVELMRRQPAYQPLNARETAVTFARDEAFRAQWRQALDALEHPGRGPAAIVAMLSQPALPFDVYLMLVVERALICQGDLDFAGTFDTIEALFRDGVPWFRQSALYVLFHLLERAGSIDDDRLERYGVMTRDFFAGCGATMTTSVATYSFSPHLAWPEIVAETHRRGRGPWLLPDLLRAALAERDEARVARLFKAIDLVGFAYGRGSLALALIEAAHAIGGAAVEGHLVECLANLRFQDEALVDEFLGRGEFASLRSQVRAASPTISGEDIPTWVDGFVVQSMLSSPDFRAQVCDAFRRALTARSTAEFLRQVLVWVIGMLGAGRGGAVRPTQAG